MSWIIPYSCVESRISKLLTCIFSWADLEQSVEMHFFFPFAYNKIWVNWGKNYFKKGTNSGNILRLSRLQKKKLNFRNSLLGKYVLDRRPNGQELASAEENRCVIHGSPQPSQQQIGREVESRRKDLWRTPFPNEVNPHDIHWEATTFFKEFISAKNCQRALKVKETGENKKRLSESQTSRSRKQVDKTS